MASSIPCPSCGAHIPADAGVCDLCGHTLHAASEPPNDDNNSDDEGESSSEASASIEESSASPTNGAAAYCTECGAAFAPTDKFCSQCGAARPRDAQQKARPVAADLPTGEVPPPEDDANEGGGEGAEESIDESAINRKLGWLVGGAVILVAVLFLGTLFSERGGDPLARTAAERNAGDDIGMESDEGPQNVAIVSVDALVERYGGGLADDLQAEVDELRAEMEGEEDLMQQTLQQEIINLYIGNGELGRAAQEQKAMAEATGDPDAWRRTGDLLYSWMEQLGQDGSPEAIGQVAPHVVDAYQAVLDQEPDNLDVRTDMATAMLQTQSPMRGVDQINRVLEDDPDHFQARFNKGIMQLYIGRVDEAVAEFEEVKRIVGEDSPYYERADRAITLAREEENRVREEGAPPSQGMPTPSPDSDAGAEEAPAFPNP